MASVPLLLVSDKASFVTGQAIVADGEYITGHSHGIVEMMELTQAPCLRAVLMNMKWIGLLHDGERA